MVYYRRAIFNSKILIHIKESELFMPDEKILCEIVKLRNTISEIEALLNAKSFDSGKARKLIDNINQEHAENVSWYNLIHSEYRNGSQGNIVTIYNATDSQLKEDLQWKHCYLTAKLKGKTFEELRNELLK